MKKQFVNVDGAQVFSADWVFQQLQAQSAQIERANRRSLAAVIIAVLFLGAVIIAILL